MRAHFTLFALVLCIQLAAQPGALDPSFSNDGLVTTSVGSGSGGGSSVIVQPDGKIIMAGKAYNGIDDDFAVVRYNTDGTLDASFSFDGKVTTAIGGGDDHAVGLVLQADGKIVVAGTTDNGSNDDFALVRYTADGTLDVSFSSDGKATTVVGTGDDRATGTVLQPDGKILVGGTADNGTDTDMAIARFNSDGSLDASFDSDGLVTTNMGTANEECSAIALQADGKIVAGGWTDVGTTDDLFVVRYDPDGSLDSGFGFLGVVITDVAGGSDVGISVAVQPDGNMLVGGYATYETYQQFVLVRYNATGTLDSNFDGDGMVITSFGNVLSRVYSLKVQSDGKILAGGFVEGQDDEFALARYFPDGSLDPNFSGDGKVTTAFGLGFDFGFSLALQSDGKILLGGRSYDGTNDVFGLARYLNDLGIGLSELGKPALEAKLLPNLIEQRASLTFDMPTSGRVTCALFNAQGQLVRTFIRGEMRPAGPWSEKLDLPDLASGAYRLSLTIGEHISFLPLVKL